MGLTTGLLGGFTLTTTLLYLSISLHTRTRLHQSQLLHQQSLLLNNIVEPLPPLPPPTAREIRVGVLEAAKDKWNAELEREVKQLQNVDWNEVRYRMEEGVSRVWQRVFEKGREGVEVGVEKVDEGAKIAYEKGREGFDQGAKKVEKEAKRTWQRGREFVDQNTAAAAGTVGK